MCSQNLLLWSGCRATSSEICDFRDHIFGQQNVARFDVKVSDVTLFVHESDPFKNASEYLFNKLSLSNDGFKGMSYVTLRIELHYYKVRSLNLTLRALLIHFRNFI